MWSFSSIQIIINVHSSSIASSYVRLTKVISVKRKFMKLICIISIWQAKFWFNKNVDISFLNVVITSHIIYMWRWSQRWRDPTFWNKIVFVWDELSVCNTAKGIVCSFHFNFLTNLYFELDVTFFKATLNIYTRDLLSAFPVQTTSIAPIEHINRQQTEVNSVKTAPNNDTKRQTTALHVLW